MDQFSLRIATLQDAKEIWQVMDTCHKHLTNKSHFICDNQFYVTDVLTNSGFGVVACDLEGKIIGSLLIKYPGMEEENLGYDLSFDFNQLSKVAHMDSCCVLPNARGNHLETKMLAYAENHLITASKYSFLMATVAPDNIPSMKSLTALGYQVMATKEKYEGYLRNIMLKKI
ncbi:MAG: GNAT family N-acetyltransferase [Lachnospiraceae bacterium]|nr:GNAT family N-acetyltransferase [Lachnospiraceae bacterium]